MPFSASFKRIPNMNVTELEAEELDQVGEKFRTEMQLADVVRDEYEDAAGAARVRKRAWDRIRDTRLFRRLYAEADAAEEQT